MIHPGDGCIDGVRFQRWRLFGHRHRGITRIRLRDIGQLGIARSLCFVPVAAAFIIRLGDKICLLGRFRGLGFSQNHIQCRHDGGSIVQTEADTENHDAMHDDRQGQGRAQALVGADFRGR